MRPHSSEDADVLAQDATHGLRLRTSAATAVWLVSVAENPEDEDAIDELNDLWCDVESEVIDGHLSPIAEDLIRQVTKQTSAPSMKELVGKK